MFANNLQICNGADDNAGEACSELVFSPIDEMFPDDAPILSSGFRILELDSKTVELTPVSLEPFFLSKLIKKKILSKYCFDFLSLVIILL